MLFRQDIRNHGFGCVGGGRGPQVSDVIQNWVVGLVADCGDGWRRDSRYRTRQRLLESLADLTGYITTQTYSFAASSFGIPSAFGTGASSTTTLLPPQHEEIRKEIRALKGLVLNR